MVDTVNASQAAAQAGAKISNSRTQLFDNYETFLALLTSQLKNQDPLSPMDSNAFTEQLTQMAGVEQQLMTNDLLKAMVEQNNAALSNSVTYIGKEVTAAASATKLDKGSATWSYELGADAAEVTLQIYDTTGKVVWSGPAPDKGEGIHDFAWDGKTSTGQQLPDGGVYVMKMTAKKGDTEIASQVLARGKVTAVEMYDGQPYLTIGGSIVPLSSVISVAEKSATSAPETPVAT